MNRVRVGYDDNSKIAELEKDWTIRTQKDIVNFRNRDRDAQRNVDVELILTKENLSNVQYINDLNEYSLKNFLSNVIKTAAGRLHEITLSRDVYLNDESDLSLRKETIAGIPAHTFDDISDLSALLASHWSRNKNVLKIVCDSKNKKMALYSGNLNYEKILSVPVEEPVKEDHSEALPPEQEVDQGKKKKTDTAPKTAPVSSPVFEYHLRPSIGLKYHRVR